MRDAASSDGKPVPVESLLDKDDLAVIAEENARSTGSKDDPAANRQEIAKLWREHEMALRIAHEHGRRMNRIAAEAQPRLRRIWELTYGKP